MLLEVEGLTAGYGRLTVLREVGLRVAAGEIVCVIGPNGAGKSTVLRAVSGQILPASGRILFRGEDTTRRSLAEKGKMGLIFIPQGNNIFPNLTVLENLEMAATILEDDRRRKNALQQVMERFSFLGEKKNRPARELSGGQRQLLALSRIRIVEPALALLDEPSLGLAPLVVDLIFREVVAMSGEGVSFLLVEQNARKGLSVSHRGYVLELGRNRLEGTGKELLSSPEVQRLYLGG